MMFTEIMRNEFQVFLETTKKTRKNEKSFPQCYIERKYLPEKALEIALKYHFNLLTEKEINMIKSFSNFTMNFWLIRGYSDEEAKIKISEIQKSNSNRRANLPAHIRKKQNVKCIEYWLDKGYTEEEGIIKISESQKTFSLEICIEKHGVEEGTKIWQDRQDNWQAALKAKPQKEIDEMNKRKDSSSMNWALNKCNGDKIAAQELLQYTNKRKDSSSMNWALNKCNGDKIAAQELFLSRNSTNFNSWISKESLNFLLPIIDFIKLTYPNLTLFYGNDSAKEYYIKGEGTIAYYDFTILELKLIIEYNGVYFHPKEGDITWRSPFGRTYDSVFARDKYKKSLAEQHEFELYYVWSDSDLTYETNYIMEIIDEKYRNYSATII